MVPLCHALVTQVLVTTEIAAGLCYCIFIPSRDRNLASLEVLTIYNEYIILPPHAVVLEVGFVTELYNLLVNDAIALLFPVTI